MGSTLWGCPEHTWHSTGQAVQPRAQDRTSLVSGLPHLNKEAPTSQCKAKRRPARRKPWDPLAPGVPKKTQVALDRRGEEGAFELREQGGGVTSLHWESPEQQG